MNFGLFYLFFTLIKCYSDDILYEGLKFILDIRF